MRFKKIISIIGLAVLSLDLLFTVRAFWLAYHSPTYQYTLNMNAFGEASFEIFLVITTLPFALYVLVNMFKKTVKGF